MVEIAVMISSCGAMNIFKSGGNTQKRKSNSDTGDEPVSKRARKEEEIEETFHTLHNKPWGNVQ